MVDLAALVPFFLAMIALQVSPGPDMLLIISRGIGQGRRVAVLTALGILLAGFVQLPLLALGVSSLVAASPVAFNLLRLIGAAYLIWVGIKLIVRARTAVDPMVAAQPVSDWRAVRVGVISNLTNPKVLVFMLAFLPQFVDPSSNWSVTAQLVALGTMQKLSGFAISGTVAIGAGGLGQWIARRPHLIVWQKRFTGAVMVGLGLRLALGGDGRPAAS